MNASFDQLSSSDVAKMLKVNRTSVTNWCKNGIINFIDVSSPDSGIPRYVITEEEVERIKKAIKRYGKLKWTKHYKKDKPTKIKEKLDDDITPLEYAGAIHVPVKPTPIQQELEKPSNKSDIDADKITKTILYIKEIKERLEDLEAEKNQLLNELEEQRKEVLDYI